MGSSGSSGRDRRGVRDVTTSANAADGGASELHAGREQEPQQSHEQDGVQCRGDLAALAPDVHQEGTLRTTSTEGEPQVMDEAMPGPLGNQKKLVQPIPGLRIGSTNFWFFGNYEFPKKKLGRLKKSENVTLCDVVEHLPWICRKI